MKRTFGINKTLGSTSVCQLLTIICRGTEGGKEYPGFKEYPAREERSGSSRELDRHGMMLRNIQECTINTIICIRIKEYT